MDWGALLYFGGKLEGHLVFCIEPVRILGRERGGKKYSEEGRQEEQF